MSTKSPYSKPEYFYNRELSWLLFNREEPRTGERPKIPLFPYLIVLNF